MCEALGYSLGGYAALCLFDQESLRFIAAIRMLTQVLFHLLSAVPPENSHVLVTPNPPTQTHTHTRETFSPLAVLRGLVCDLVGNGEQQRVASCYSGVHPILSIYQIVSLN